MIRVRTLGVVGLCLGLSVGGIAEAATAVLQASRDNTLFSENAALSLGAGQYLFAGVTGLNQTRRALLRFDIAGTIPAGSTVTSVVLRLNNSKTISGNVLHTLHRVTRDWGEAGSTGFNSEEGTGGTALSGDATWAHTFSNTGLWSSTGGDFAPSASGVQTVGGVGFYTWSSTQMVGDVQSWLDAPAANFGWILLGDEAASPTAKRFDSRQHGTAGNRPSLVVGYDEPPPPELGPPALVALLTGAQEVPPAASAENGIAIVSYARSTRTLTWYVHHSITNASLAHIHGPAGEGTNAAVVVDLGNAASPIRGSAVLSATQEVDLFNGRYYVNVHSGNFPAGEIRGQLLARASFAGMLDGSQEVPPVVTPAGGAAYLVHVPATGELLYAITHSVSNATSAHLHGPALPGVNQGILVNLGAAASPITGSTVLTAADAAALAKGFVYVNVHSAAFPAGEIRGQLQALNAQPSPELAARLDAGQEVPPQPNAFAGAAAVAFDHATRRLHIALAHTVTNASLAHIHGPAGEGTNGPVVFDLGVAASPLEADYTLSPGQAVDLLRGRYYFNVHSTDFPAGAIRGQILPQAAFTAVLQGGQETPPITTWHHGVGHFLFDHSTRQLTYTIVHSLTNATAAHIHGPADPGIAAAVRYPLPAESPITGSVQVTLADLPALLAGRLYVNVHSAAYPAGEVRGQLVPVEAVPAASHVAQLLGASEVPPVASTNSGLGIFAYDCATRLLHYDIRHSITNPLSAHIHGPAGVGTNAGIVFAFPVALSPLVGCVPFTAIQAGDFLAGRYYVNVHSPTFPGGELRGQILPTTWRLTATLQGRQETAGVATDARGQGVFQYAPDSQTLSYHIEHTLASPTAAHLHGPAGPGVDAGVVHGFSSPQSPITGQVVLSPSQATSLLQGRYYVNVHSAAFPAGELRGQVLVTQPDSDCNDIDDHWELQHGLTPGGYDPQADDDGDGHSVWQEFVADTAPTSAASVALIDVELDSVTVETSPFRAYQIQHTTNLVAGVWENLGIPFLGTGGAMPVIVTNTAPASFYRHAVINP